MNDRRPTYAKILERCRTVVRKHRGFVMKKFETRTYREGSYDLVSIARRSPIVGRPTVAIIAGFHGEEPAGPVAIMLGLEKFIVDAERFDVNLVVIPCANPWGYDRGTRATPKSKYTNGGYVHGIDKLPSEFSKLKRELLSSNAEYFIDFHEDYEARGTYTYAFGDRSFATSIVKAMRKVLPITAKPKMDHYMKIKPDVGGGISYEGHDGSSEDMMSHLPNAIASFATETPSSFFPLKTRARAHINAARELIKIAGM